MRNPGPFNGPMMQASSSKKINRCPCVFTPKIDNSSEVGMLSRMDFGVAVEVDVAVQSCPVVDGEGKKVMGLWRMK